MPRPSIRPVPPIYPSPSARRTLDLARLSPRIITRRRPSRTRGAWPDRSLAAVNQACLSASSAASCPVPYRPAARAPPRANHFWPPSPSSLEVEHSAFLPPSPFALLSCHCREMKTRYTALNGHSSDATVCPADLIALARHVHGTWFHPYLRMHHSLSTPSS